MKKLIILLLPVVAALIVLHSCKKETLDTSAGSEVISSLNPQIEMPTVTEGRLNFKSENQLKDYYNWLVNEINKRDTEKFARPDSLLHAIENDLRYYSARQMIEDKKNSDLREGETQDWLLDEIRKSMLNSEYEITIGEYVYVYFSENQIYKIPLTDVNQILAFRTLEKGDDQYVPKDIITSETELISAYKLVKKKKRGGGGGGGFTGCVFDLYYEIVGGFNCEPMKRGVGVEHLVSYVDNFQSIWNTSVNTNWTINWGDGSATSSADNQWYYNFSHTYPGPGTYTITITASYVDPCGNPFVNVQEQHTETIEVTDNTCSNANHNKVAHDENSQKRMTSEIWVKHDFFGEHQVADTKSYEWQDPWWGSAGWYEEDAYVKAEIYWTFRDSECNVEMEGGFFDGLEFGGLETDWCNSCQHKRAAKTIAGEGNLYVSDDEVHSYHKVVNEGIVLERNLVISTCD